MGKASFLIFFLSFQLLFSAGIEIEIDEKDVEGSLDRTKNEFKDKTEKQTNPDYPERNQTLTLGEKHKAPLLGKTPDFAETYYYNFKGKRYSNPINLLGYQNGVFRFKQFASTNDIEIDSKQLEGVKFFTHQNAYIGSGSRVTLTNNDSFLGKIGKLDKDYLHLHTWYAGQLKIPRVMIYKIETQHKTILNGLYDAKDIKKSSNSTWVIKPDHFSGLGSIGKEVKLPDKCTITFRLSSKLGSPNFRIGLFANSITDSSCIQVMFRRSYVTISERRSRSVVSARDIPDLSNNGRVKITLNKPQKTIKIFINGKSVTQKTDVSINSNAKLFYVYAYSQMTVHNFKITSGIDDFDFEDEERKKDDIQLINGESFNGIAGQMLNKSIELKTADGMLNVPVKNMHSILFNTENAERARRMRQDVILYFTSGGRLTFMLDQIKGDYLYGRSENFETDLNLDDKKSVLKIDKRAISGIRFNPYDKQDNLIFEY